MIEKSNKSECFDFRGVGTAIVTPFKQSKEIDYDTYKKLLKLQLEAEIPYIVVAGTTGESTVLSDKELFELVDFTLDVVGNRTHVIVGCGGNDTSKVVTKVKELNKHNVSGYLVVTPYYNKPTQEGLYKHYIEVSKASEKPLILYNVPGRTSCKLMPNTVARLIKECSNISAIKEASGDVNFAMDMLLAVKNNAKTHCCLLSGDDSLTLPLIACGYDGVISVVSNEIPKQMKVLVDYALQGNYTAAREIQYKILPLMKENFIETSPAPVKYALMKMGLGDGSLRLPLSELIEKQNMDKILKELGLYI